MAIQDFTAGQILTAAQMDSLQANDYNQTVSTKTDSYVLVAADKGTRVVMNKATATTITVNDSLFNAGDTLFIQNIGAGTCTVTAGTATVTTAGSLALAQWGGGTLYFTSASAAIFFSGGSPAYGTATGGIGSPTAVTIGGVNYEYLQFNSTGTLTVTKAGFFDYLAIGGGGGSRQQVASRAAGGGGAGQVVIGSVYLDANQTITIGAGSGFFAIATEFVQASATTIAATAPFAIRAIGNNVSPNGQVSKSLGYVGGGVGTSDGGTDIAAVTESTQQGYRGGSSTSTSNAGGGGGQSGRGANGASTTGGAGGTGFDMATFIGGTPSPTHRATGGGGGGSGAGGAGGNSSASSNAGSNNSTPSSAAANSGSGGGGGYGVVTTGNGGSGVCFIRYKV